MGIRPLVGDALGSFVGERDACLCLVLEQAALLVLLATAAKAGIIASGFGHVGQQLKTRGRTYLCMQPCWRTPPSTIFSSHVIGILPPKRGGKDAGSAEARCIPAIIGANHAAGSAVWAPSTTGASVYAAHAMAVAHAGRQPRCAFLDPRSTWRQLSFLSRFCTRAERQGCNGSKSSSV